jgi:hypothetical protein
LDAAQPPDNPPGSRRHRLAFLAIVAILAGAIGVLVTASIVIELFATGRPAARREAPSAAEQAACNRDVRALLERLVREAARLEQLPLEGRGEDLVKTWDSTIQAWDDEWAALGERCRFAQLADRGLGTAYDRIAWVHHSLPTTKLKYAEMMARFSRDLAGEVAEMRRALDKSLVDLGERGAGQGQNEPR